MASSTEPRSGLKYGWSLGENNWNTDMDNNLLQLGRFGFHLSVKNSNLTTAPSSPSTGDTHIVATGATGTWAGQDNKVAIWSGSAWVYATPRTGWVAYDEALDDDLIYKSSAWTTKRVGYSSGGAVTQATSRVTGVTLNKTNGAITLASEAGSTSYQTFVVTNSTVLATDTVVVSQKSGTDKYMIFVTNISDGAFSITLATTGGTTTEQPVLNFAILRAKAA